MNEKRVAEVVLDIQGDVLEPEASNITEELGFVSTRSTGGSSSLELSGNIDLNVGSPDTLRGWKDDYSIGVGGGFATRYLQKKGFGWLLENDDDDEYQKPLSEELDINFSDIYYKVLCVLFPLRYFRLKLTLVREQPDFWGPLFVVLAYALLSLYGQFSVVPWIMSVWFCGSFVVYFLTRVVGGNMTFSQSLGVIGYCLLPLVVMILPLSLLNQHSVVSSFLKIVGIVWAVYSATILLFAEELCEKRKMLLYPVFLLYLYFFSLYTGV